MTLPVTPSQTIGPFFAVGLIWADDPDVVGPGTPGAVVVGGRVLDGAGEPVRDALVETWQADPAGCFAHPDAPRDLGGARSRLPWLRALPNRRRGPLGGPYGQAGAAAGARRRPGSAAPGRVGVRPGAAQPAGDPDLLPR